MSDQGGRAPAGLRFSERKLWYECPSARDALARLARTRADYTRLRAVSGVMASTMRDVLNIVEVRPDYPWQGGALKAQMREDITAYEALGLDLEVHHV